MQLSDSLTSIPGVGESYAKKLIRLKLHTVSDLLNHFPRKYLDLSQIKPIVQLDSENHYCFKACLIKLTNLRIKKGHLQTAIIGDDHGKLPVLWFNQPYLSQTLKVGDWYFFSGQVKLQRGKLTLISPDFEPIKDNQLHTNRIVPIYSETSGVSSKWIRNKIFYCLNSTNIKELVPDTIVKQNFLVNNQTAYQQIHFPNHFSDLKSAETRLAFNDLLSIYLKSSLTKLAWSKHLAPLIKINKQLHQQLINSLPFQLTQDQNTVITDIFADLNQTIPMNRLLQGDVGSGKTIVAASAALQVIKTGFQVMIMAPTQVLAQQHFDTFNRLFSPYDIEASLVSSASKKRHTSPLLIGTHALLHDKQLINYQKLGLLVMDEQHRFGVLQRSHFLKPTNIPHILTMTATPIPRTIALSFYGHLHISNLKTLPQARRSIKTWLIPEDKRPAAYKWIKDQISAGNQAFIVCPFIDESGSDSLKNVRAATAEFTKLQAVFPEFKLDLLHGRLKPEQKNLALDRFRAQKTNILVTTPVIEVGVDIPNANLIVIEGAQRFGLAQLHQLRGRVGRGHQQAYCLLFATDDDSTDIKRLKYLEQNHNGLTLARYDLKLRGAGDIFGTAQSGYLDTRFRAFWDKGLRNLARASAQQLTATNPDLADTTLQNLTPQLAKIDVSN